MQLYLLFFITLAIFTTTTSVGSMGCECTFPDTMSGTIFWDNIIEGFGVKFEVNYTLNKVLIYPGGRRVIIHDITTNTIHKFNDKDDLTKGACKSADLPDVYRFPTCIPKGWYKGDYEGEIEYKPTKDDSHTTVYVDEVPNSNICKPYDVYIVREVDGSFDDYVAIELNVLGYTLLNNNANFQPNVSRCSSVDLGSF